MLRFRTSASRGLQQILRMGGTAFLIFSLSPKSLAHTRKADPASRRRQQKGPQKPAQTDDAAQTFTLVGAGDIATCKHLESAQATAKLIEGIPGTVFAAGDLAYENGTPTEFRDCYGPTW